MFPKVFATTSGIDRGIAKLTSRIGELERLDVRTAVIECNGANDVVQDDIKETIRDVFGTNSPEFRQHQYIVIWAGQEHIDMDAEERVEGCERGKVAVRAILQGLIARLQERRDEVGTTHHGSARPYMENSVLLAELRAMADGAPDFNAYTGISRPHLAWIGRAHALLERHNPNDATEFKVSCAFLASNLTRDATVGSMMATIYRAISSLELSVPAQGAQVYGPGEVYDFQKDLKAILHSATSDLLIVDPYLDDEVFDAYLSTVSSSVSTRMLAHKYAASLKSVLPKFVTQHGMKVEIRSSTAIHDRVLFIDDVSCWVVGQSLKDAAKTRTTYMAPLASDATPLKLAEYERIWRTATPI